MIKKSLSSIFCLCFLSVFLPQHVDAVPHELADFKKAKSQPKEHKDKKTQIESVFTDRICFESALGAFFVEGFESTPLSGDGTSGGIGAISFDSFSVSSTPNAIKVLNAPYFGAGNTTDGGSNFLYLDTDLYRQGSVSTFIFETPVYGIGFDYSQLNEPSSMPAITINGSVFSIALNPTPFSEVLPLFWGIVSDSPFSSFTINSGTDSGFGIDQLAFRAAVPVPEPFTMFLLGSGLAGLVALRKRINK